MVKVTGYEPYIQPGGPKKSGRTGAAEGNEFAQALEKAQAVADTVGDVVTIGTTAPPPLYGPTPAAGLGLARQAEGQTAAEQTLDLLDTYQAALGNPRRTLKSIAPLVQRLEAQVDRINEIVQGLPQEDGLRPILSDIASTAAVETVKFNRGDYI